jgi:hypothetical protein
VSIIILHLHDAAVRSSSSRCRHGILGDYYPQVGMQVVISKEMLPTNCGRDGRFGFIYLQTRPGNVSNYLTAEAFA